jgi:hypothetical protein
MGTAEICSGSAAELGSAVDPVFVLDLTIESAIVAVKD